MFFLDGVIDLLEKDIYTVFKIRSYIYPGSWGTCSHPIRDLTEGGDYYEYI